jgi:carbamoyltransferase
MGLNLSHDRSACLLKDGKILVCIAEERLDRDKKSLGFVRNTGYKIPPLLSLSYCLNYAKIALDDLDLLVADNALSAVDLPDLKRWIPVKDKSKFCSLPAPSHHLAHAYSAYFCSPFADSAVLIADAYGSEIAGGSEAESGFYARGNCLDEVFKTFQRIAVDRSGQERYFGLTFIYAFITRALGFTLPYDNLRPADCPDEAGKTMALAAFGRPRADWPEFIKEKAGRILTGDFLSWALENGVAEEEFGGIVSKVRPPGERLTQFHKDLAYKAQSELEKGMLLYANKLFNETGSENLCIAGGAGLNCVANRLIKERTRFKRMFVQPAATDDGTAIGCAMYGWHKIAGRKKRFYLKNVYLGRVYPDREIGRLLAGYGIFRRPLSKKALLRNTARLIAEGKIVGWFQGGSEFGPRALGHRSILADPRDPRVKQILNKKVKSREGFRPYAPSILQGAAVDFFDLDQPCPFMLLVARIKEEKRKLIPGVLHIDRTARVQTVNSRDNGIFYDLIREFHRITKAPLILNTSFNLKGKPIVETPADALTAFFHSGMDALVIGGYLLKK